MTGIKDIFDDKRPIKSMHFPETERLSYFVGSNGVTEIRPYLKNGEIAHVTWFAIIKDGVITSRVNGKFIEVVRYE